MYRCCSALVLVLLVPFVIVGCGGGGQELPEDPGLYGVNLPSGGSESFPAGKYVGHFLASGRSVDAELESWFPTCSSDMVYIDKYLDMVVGADPGEQTTIALAEADGGRYTGSLSVDEDDGSHVSISVDLSRDRTADRWIAQVTQEVDSDGDGVVDFSGSAPYQLEPRLDWSEIAEAAGGSFTALEIVTHSGSAGSVSPYTLVGGGSEWVSQRFQFPGDGYLVANTGVSLWYFLDDGVATALVTDEDAGEAHEITLPTLASDYSEMTARNHVIPDPIVDPDYRSWQVAEVQEFAMYGMGAESPRFQQENVAIEVRAGSQIEYDTDGSGGDAAPYYYFGADLSGLSGTLSLDRIDAATARLTPPGDSGADPLDMYYGYLRVAGQGYLVMANAETSGTGDDSRVRFETLVFAVDDQGKLTGDGALQGFDFPVLDGTTTISEAEWLAMDNEGLVEFGDGVDADRFDFIVTAAGGPLFP